MQLKEESTVMLSSRVRAADLQMNQSCSSALKYAKHSVGRQPTSINGVICHDHELHADKEMAASPEITSLVTCSSLKKP